MAALATSRRPLLARSCSTRSTMISISSRDTGRFSQALVTPRMTLLRS